ncbi:MAG: UDP-glucose 4-epimerase GalE [Myxococcota bacterium]|nr:UDP-glucose 4-epimerase GalE [Myxococcota bacterium]
MGKQILVVGGAGYIGSHCVRDLLDQGAEVVVFDDLSTGHSEAVTCELVEGDIRDPNALDRAFAGHQFDAVMHFAAKSLVGESVHNPLHYFDVNVRGTITLLEAMRKAEVLNLVFSSTCAVYGDPDRLPLDESHPQRPVSPYGASKKMVEEVLRSASDQHGFRIASLRYFNAAGAHPDGTLGESHNPETHLIPLALDALLGRRPALKLFGRDYDTRDGTCVRDYIHILDLALAHRQAADYLVGGGASGAWNLGTGNGTTVLEILESIERVTGQAVPYEDAPRRDGDPPGLYASAEAAKRTFGWEPRFAGVDDIVSTAWQWSQAPRY